MATPEIVIGAALLSMFVLPPFATFSYSISASTRCCLPHIMFSISFVVVVVRSRLIGFDRSLEEAAADLGSTPLTTFRTVTLPLLAPGIVAAGALAFALSLDDFVIFEPELRCDHDVPSLHLRREPAGDPRPGQRPGDDAVRGHRGGDHAGATPAAGRTGTPIRPPSLVGLFSPSMYAIRCGVHNRMNGSGTPTPSCATNSSGAYGDSGTPGRTGRRGIRHTWTRFATASTISATASAIGTPFFCVPSRYAERHRGRRPCRRRRRSA